MNVYESFDTKQLSPFLIAFVVRPVDQEQVQMNVCGIVVIANITKSIQLARPKSFRCQVCANIIIDRTKDGTNFFVAVQ